MEPLRSSTPNRFPRPATIAYEECAWLLTLHVSGCRSSAWCAAPGGVGAPAGRPAHRGAPTGVVRSGADLRIGVGERCVGEVRSPPPTTPTSRGPCAPRPLDAVFQHCNTPGNASDEHHISPRESRFSTGCSHSATPTPQSPRATPAPPAPTARPLLPRARSRLRPISARPIPHPGRAPINTLPTPLSTDHPPNTTYRGRARMPPRGVVLSSNTGHRAANAPEPSTTHAAQRAPVARGSPRGPHTIPPRSPR